MYSVSSRLFNSAGSKQAVLLIVLQMSVQVASAQTASAQESGPAAANASSVAPVVPVAHAFHFPAWPQRSQYQKEVIPPPPPGPYMSTALSDHSVMTQSFGMNSQKYKAPMQGNHNTFAAPMDMFSPDLAWPDLRPGKKRGSHRWKPENGYQYRESVPVVNHAPNKPGHYNAGQYNPNQHNQSQYNQGQYNKGLGQTNRYRGANMPSRTPPMPMGSNVR